MKFWVGVTDNQWFNYLSEAKPDEVNFWQPGATPPFTGAPLGLPFLFKLKRVGSNIELTLEIRADVRDGVPDNIVRTVTENCRTLKFKNHGFEEK